MYQIQSCPACKSKLLSQANRHGQVFWFCEKRPVCKTALSDDNGNPIIPKEIHQCECKKGILLQKTGFQGRTFWGCTQYPECRYTYNDRHGKPVT